ncbi:MAG: hypothetical protein NT013_23375 [Planctomycetia bacterium]|nr:hypothetical protein [Planctomycetia bacterium]
MPMAEMELLEDRAQLTPLPYAANDVPLLVPSGDPSFAHSNGFHELNLTRSLTWRPD